DRVCELDARLQLSPDGVLIRRLDLQGVVDIDPGSESRTTCPPREEMASDAEPIDLTSAVQLSLRQVRVEPADEQKPWFSKGHINVHAPVDLINRFTDVTGRFEGWTRLDGDFRYDGVGSLPYFSGKV